MALTRISSAGIQTSPTFSGDVRIGAGATLESTGNAYVTGITTLGRGSSGDVYLYNPANSALSGTENSVYGWKAKTYCAGLQVNTSLYLSRSGSNGLQLSYNNATGSYITANSGFLRVGVPYGGDFNLYGNNIYIKDRLQTKNFAHFQKVSGTEYNTHLYGGDSAIKLSTTNEGILVSGGATVTGNLSVGGTVTYEDVSNVDSIGIITARSHLYVGGELNLIGSSDAAKYIDVRVGTSNNLNFRSTSGGDSNHVTMMSLNTSGASIVGDLSLGDGTADSAAGPEFKLNRNSASPANADYLGQIKFAGRSSTGVERNYAKITGKILDVTNGAEDGIIEFAHIKAGSQVITGRFRSDSLQLLNGTSLTVAGTTTLSDNLDITGSIDSTVAGADNALTLETTSSGDPKICFNAAGAGGHRIEYLRDSLTLNFTNGSSNRLQISAAGHTLPGINDTYDLGSNTVRWRCTFVDKYVGDADLNVTIGCNAGLGITAASTSATKNIIIGHCAGQRL